MQGIQIPIGGNLAPFMAVAAQLQGEMRSMSKSVRAALGPARTDAKSAAESIRQLWQSTKGAHTGFRVLRTAVGSVVPVMRALGSAGRAAFSGMLSLVNRATSAVSGFASKMRAAIPGGGMLGPLAGVAGIAGSIALLFASVKSGLGLAGELERTGIALEALTGSGDGAKTVLDEMRASWLRTGVAIADQAPTIQKFLALGFSQGDAVQLQKNILDVAGAVGMTTSEAALLGSALAQVKAKGVVSMEELRQQIAEKGVPVIQALADKLGVAQGELIKMVEDGKVPAQTLIDLFLNMEGSFSKFIGGSTRMGATFLGMLGRLRGAWSLLLADFAAPIADSLKPLIASAMGMVESFRARAVAAGKAVGDALISAFALVKSGKTFDLLRAGFAFAITGAMDILMRGLRGAVAFLGTALPPIFEVAMSKFKDPNFWNGLGLFLRGAAMEFGAEINAALGRTGKANELRATAMVSQTAGSGLMSMAGDAETMGDVISQALLDAGVAAADAMAGPVSNSFAKARQDIELLFNSVRKDVAALRAATAVPPPNKGRETPGSSGDGGLKPKAENLLTLATSMARVGGGGFGMTFSPMITEARKGNTLLARIERNTRTPARVPAIV